MARSELKSVGGHLYQRRISYRDVLGRQNRITPPRASRATWFLAGCLSTAALGLVLWYAAAWVVVR